MSDLKDYLHTAIRAAKAAGLIQQANIGSDLGISTKTSETDLVTRVDKECEARIREIILGAHPDHSILGEEGGEAVVEAGDSRYRWIVDPIDGTLNYAHGFPFYCVSIGLEIDGILSVGVVYDATRNELFSAMRGQGAYLNGVPMRVTQESTLRSAMLATGFAYSSDVVSENVEIFARVMPHVRAIRRPGAAALDLSYVACGRLDGFWELKLSPWDVAAGVLFVQEAGGKVTAADGSVYKITDRVLVASNGVIHDDLLRVLALETLAKA